MNQDQPRYSPMWHKVLRASGIALAVAAVAVAAAGCGEGTPAFRTDAPPQKSQAATGTTATQQQAMQNQYDVAGLERFRAEKDSGFRQRGSPLTERFRARFKGLEYYPAAADLLVVARLEKFPKPEPVNLLTTTGEPRPMLRYGQLHFAVTGKECVLVAYQSADHPEHLFLPFKDATNGTETYGAGRYIDLAAQPDGAATQVIDFNLAYNPYCAYNPDYSCPVVPRENFLTVPIRAGERTSEADNH